MHFEVGIVAKLVDADEGLPQPDPLERLSFFGSSVPSPFPHRSDETLDLLSRLGASKHLSEVSTLLGVEAQVPHAIGGEPTAVTQRTERCGGGGNNAKAR